MKFIIEIFKSRSFQKDKYDGQAPNAIGEIYGPENGNMESKHVELVGTDTQLVHRNV